MARYTKTNLGTDYASKQQIDTNLDDIAIAIGDTLSRKGDSPNAMEADLDMNSNDILNVGSIDAQTLSSGGVALSPSDVVVSRIFETTTSLINSRPNKNFFMKTGGYDSVGDGGGAVWYHTGVTGLTASQSPSDLADARLSDANGNEWKIVKSESYRFKQYGTKEDGLTNDLPLAQAILDSTDIEGLVYVTDNMVVDTVLKLRKNKKLVLPAGSKITWGGSAGGTVIDTPSTTVLVNSGVICDGGIIDMNDAGFGVATSSCQLCEFDLEFDGNSTTSIVFQMQGNSTTTTDSPFTTSNITSNHIKRVVHRNQCGTLVKLIGENNSPRGGIITLNTFGPLRACLGNALAGIRLEGYVDTNYFDGHVNLRPNANNIKGIDFNDDSTVYENKFTHVSIGAYGASTGRTGVYFGNDTRHNEIDKLFVDGDLDSEGGNVAAGTAQSYRVGLHHLGSEGVRFKDVVKNYESKATYYNGENTEVQLADDTATSFTLRRNQAVIVVNSGDGNATGVVWVKPKATGAAIKKLAGDATFFEVTTGALTGTTGTDARFTVSAHTDGKIYFENRLGSLVTISYCALAAFT